MLQHENVIERIYIHLHPYLSPRAKAAHGNDYSYKTITAVDPGSSDKISSKLDTMLCE